MNQVGERPNAASQVLDRLRTLKDRADSTAARVADRLSPVTRQANLSTAAEVVGKAEEMPKYFSDIRGIVFSINEALNKIDETIDRLEL